MLGPRLVSVQMPETEAVLCLALTMSCRMKARGYRVRYSAQTEQCVINVMADFKQTTSSLAEIAYLGILEAR